MRCHLVNDQNCLGRSLVIDLDADCDKNRFRLVDHRSIESIIFKNVKYVLKSSGGKSFRDIDTELDRFAQKWDQTQLKVGDIFSGTTYYQTVSYTAGEKIKVRELNNRELTYGIDKNILSQEMENANVWESEQYLSKTDLAVRLTNARNMCF